MAWRQLGRARLLGIQSAVICRRGATAQGKLECLFASSQLLPRRIYQTNARFLPSEHFGQITAAVDDAGNVNAVR